MKLKRFVFYMVAYVTLFLVGFFFCPWIFAQTSTASIIAQDTSGQLWTNGTLTYTFQGNGSFNGTYQWNGADLPSEYLVAQTINLDNTASGTFTIPSSGAITPSGSSWKITVCPNASVNCITNAVPINGATPNISSAINPTLPPISVNGAPLPLAYQDSEVKTTIRTGSLYYDTTLGQGPKYFDGTTWHLFGSNIGQVLLNPTTTQIITQPDGTALEIKGNTVFTTINAPVNNPATAPGDDTGGVGFNFNWTMPTLNSNISQTQSGMPVNCNFSSPGWNFGQEPGVSGIALWSVQKCLNITNNILDQGIGQGISLRTTKTGNGDLGGLYDYFSGDGGNVDYGGEGIVGLSVQGGQSATWFHGLVGTGATTGTVQLPVIFNSGAPNTRSQVSTGGFMLDISKPIISGHTLNAGSLVSSMAVYQTQVDVAVSQSEAWGNITSDIPNNVPPTASSSITLTVNVLGGHSGSGFNIGPAWLAGAQNPEQVTITAVGTLTGGNQSVTFNHLYPNGASGSSLWQGGTQGFYSGSYFNNLLSTNGFRNVYYVFGATDASHIVGGMIAAAAWHPITSNNSAQTYQVPLNNLSGNGTTVTAFFSNPTAGLAFSNQPTAIISGSTGCDGTASNVQIGETNGFNVFSLSWSQASCSSSANAFISLPQSYFAFTIYPGATVIQPQDTVTGLVPLEPNRVPWVAGDTIENALNPSSDGGAITIVHNVSSPDSQNQAALGTQEISTTGLGISGAYHFYALTNLNPCNIYLGCGGLLSLNPLLAINGPNTGLANFINSPLPGNSFITVGCYVAELGGCGNTTPWKFFDAPGGNLYWDPSLGQLQSANGFETGGTTSSRTLGTGNGDTGINGVYLTSANGFGSFANINMGEYGTFGNGGSLDTSAKMGIATLYNPTLYLGATPPAAHQVNLTGVTGSTTYTYACTALTANGESLPTATFNTTNGNAVLSSSNYISPICSAGYGGEGINIYRISGSTYNSGLICHATDNTTLSNAQANNCKDIGQVATGSVPTVDTTSKIETSSGNAVVVIFGAPASSSASCTVPQIEYDSAFIYTCVATNTWTRAATVTF